MATLNKLKLVRVLEYGRANYVSATTAGVNVDFRFYVFLHRYD
jgi:hypothetical protein